MWHLYPLKVTASKRWAVFERLRSEGIGVQVNYLPAYRHPFLSDYGYSRALCPNAEDFFDREISIPMYSGLDGSQVVRFKFEVRSAIKAHIHPREGRALLVPRG